MRRTRRRVRPRARGPKRSRKAWQGLRGWRLQQQGLRPRVCWSALLACLGLFEDGLLSFVPRGK